MVDILFQGYLVVTIVIHRNIYIIIGCFLSLIGFSICRCLVTVIRKLLCDILRIYQRGTSYCLAICRMADQIVCRLIQTVSRSLSCPCCCSCTHYISGEGSAIFIRLLYLIGYTALSCKGQGMCSTSGDGDFCIGDLYGYLDG